VTAAEACDEGHWVRHILDQVLGVTLFKFPLPVITDSESLSAVSKITNNIQDTRSRIEAAQPREGLELNELEQLWVPGSKQVADIVNMHEKPEMRYEMLKTDPKGKHDENNAMDENNTAASIESLQLYNDSYYQYSTSKQVADEGIKNL
jgi:hypothetical protein